MSKSKVFAGALAAALVLSSAWDGPGRAQEMNGMAPTAEFPADIPQEGFWGEDGQDIQEGGTEDYTQGNPGQGETQDYTQGNPDQGYTEDYTQGNPDQGYTEGQSPESTEGLGTENYDLSQWEEEVQNWSEDDWEPLEEPGELHENAGEEMPGTIYRRTEGGRTIEDFELLNREDAKRDFKLSEEYMPTSVFLDVPEILQNPQLPTGCEAVSLTMALRYEGFDVDKITVARDFLIYNHETDNMAIGYVGDPFSEEGAGCFPPALTATAMDFFEDQEADFVAYNITGSTMEELLPYLASGTPVIVWATMYMAEPEFTREDAEYEEHIYQWYRQEHCVILTGYDLEKNILQVNDPLEGIVERDLEEFSRLYTKTGHNAVVLRALTPEEIHS